MKVTSVFLIAFIAASCSTGLAHDSMSCSGALVQKTPEVRIATSNSGSVEVESNKLRQSAEWSSSVAVRGMKCSASPGGVYDVRIARLDSEVMRVDAEQPVRIRVYRNGIEAARATIDPRSEHRVKLVW